MYAKLVLAGACALALSTPALADIVVSDAYARASMPGARTGAAFMVIRNTGAEDDRLLSASSDAAARVELHSHIDQGGGVMKMREAEEGFAIPAHGDHALARGGDHVMFMGLAAPFDDGAEVSVTLTFEKAGDIVVAIPVDLERMPDHGAGGHDGMDHGKMKMGTPSE